MFKWGFIGYGTIAEQVSGPLKDAGHLLASVTGRNYEKAEKFAAKHSAKAYRTLEEFLASDIDAVYIATPNDSHVYYCEQCILAKKPVLCEKPFALNKADTEHILDLAKQEGVYVAEAMWTWHNKISLQVKEWIKEGRIGDIVSVKGNYGFPMLKKGDRSGRLVNPKLGGGALLDIGIYPVRYIYELFGMPESADVSGELYNGVDVDENIVMHYPGFDAELAVSFKKMRGENMLIKGTKGSIRVPMFHMAKEAVLKTDKKETVKGKTILDAYQQQFADVAEDIADGKIESRHVPHRSTLDTMELLDMLREKLGVHYPEEQKALLKEKGPNHTIKGISHLGFNCKDLKLCTDFYCNILGCEKQFVLTYKDLAETIRRETEAAGAKEPAYVKALEKQGERTWLIYLKWTDTCFIELFDQMGAFIRNVPNNHSLNYTHYSIEVEDIHGFRDYVLIKGGKEYIESDIRMGLDQTWQMWMHDPEGNRFELMEYTERSYQLLGRN